MRRPSGSTWGNCTANHACFSGVVTTAPLRCPAPMCADPVTLPGQCCPSCPPVQVRFRVCSVNLKSNVGPERISVNLCFPINPGQVSLPTRSAAVRGGGDQGRHHRPVQRVHLREGTSHVVSHSAIEVGKFSSNNLGKFIDLEPLGGSITVRACEQTISFKVVPPLFQLIP